MMCTSCTQAGQTIEEEEVMRRPFRASETHLVSPEMRHSCQQSTCYTGTMMPSVRANHVKCMMSKQPCGKVRVDADTERRQHGRAPAEPADHDTVAPSMQWSTQHRTLDREGDREAACLPRARGHLLEGAFGTCGMQLREFF